MKFRLNLFLFLFILFFSCSFTLQAAVKTHNDCLRYVDNYRYQFLLDLSQCGLQDKDLPFVLSYLYNHPNISILFLDGNNIGPEGAQLLAKNLQIDFLGLDDNHAGPEGAAALASNRSLSGLSLSGNYIGTRGALALADATFTNLNVDNNGIEPPGISAIVRNAHIRFLSIADHTLDDDNLVALLHNKQIKELDVSYTNFGFAEIKTLVNVMNLDSIGLNGLELGDAIIPILAAKQSFLYLDLADNKLTPKAAADLMAVFNPDFQDLNVSHNRIGDQGLAILAKAPLSVLPYFSVEDNQISDAGGFALANTEILMLDLEISHNYLSSEAIQALQNNPQIVYMNADYNQPLSAGVKNPRKMTALISHCERIDSLRCAHYLRKIRGK